MTFVHRNIEFNNNFFLGWQNVFVYTKLIQFYVGSGARMQLAIQGRAQVDH